MIPGLFPSHRSMSEPILSRPPRALCHDQISRTSLFEIELMRLTKMPLSRVSSSLDSTSVAQKLPSTPTDSSVLPAWRGALMHTIVGSEWTHKFTWETIKNSSTFATEWMDVLREIAPDSSAYMSEADLLEPN